MDLFELKAGIEFASNVGIVGIAIYVLFSVLRKDKSLDDRVQVILDAEARLRKECRDDMDKLEVKLAEVENRRYNGMKTLGEKLDSALSSERECQQDRIFLLEYMAGMRCYKGSIPIHIRKLQEQHGGTDEQAKPSPA